MAPSDLTERVATVRHFNRFYTRQIGVLNEHFLESPFSLAATRVLYEIASHTTRTAKEIGRDLGLDAGYLSRILRDFKKLGFIDRRPSKTDGRQSHVQLTAKGRKALATLTVRSNKAMATLLEGLSIEDQQKLVNAMHTIERVLGPRSTSDAPVVFRLHQPGDMGWVVYRQGVLYAHEHNFNSEFEALVARIVADFLDKHDPQRERCWMAEMDGEIVGSVFLVRKSNTVAKLRLLAVEKTARGHGIGRRLVTECVRFAKQVGYRRVTLWTQQSLTPARRLYEQAGFRLVHQKPHHSFGQDLVGETWDLEL